MVFSNNFFLLVFLPFFLATYLLAAKNLKNTIALIASLFFYAWGAPSFIFILLFSASTESLEHAQPLLCRNERAICN